ncbi:MAG: PEPxxWA-CTERM sorting domain-containing protein [Thermaurantiacus sp.]
MIRTTFVSAAAVAAFAFTATAASAVTVVGSNCFDLALSYCELDIPPPPVIQTQATADAAAAAYNVFAAANDFSKQNIVLTLLDFIWEDGGANPGFPGTVTGSGTTGTWSVTGFIIDYIAVKAGTATFLYHVGGVSSGDWFTGNSSQDMSNIRFFGSEAVIPEPATWAMLILGFGLVGASLRRRKGSVHVTA